MRVPTGSSAGHESLSSSYVAVVVKEAADSTLRHHRQHLATNSPTMQRLKLLGARETTSLIMETNQKRR